MARSRSAAIRTGKHGLVSKKSKTGRTECSRAASLWQIALHAGRKAGAEVHKILGKCRSMARMLKSGKMQRKAGNELKAQVLEGRAVRGLTITERRAQARLLVAQRRARGAAAAAPAAAPAPRGLVGPPRPVRSTRGKPREERLTALTERAAARTNRLGQEGRSVAAMKTGRRMMAFANARVAERRAAREAESRARATATQQAAATARRERQVSGRFTTDASSRRARAGTLRAIRGEGSTRQKGLAGAIAAGVHTTRGQQIRMTGTPEARERRGTLQTRAQGRLQAARLAAEAARPRVAASTRAAAPTPEPAGGRRRAPAARTARAFDNFEIGPSNAHVNISSEGHARAREIFGREVSPRDLASMTGAPHDARVTVTPTYGGRLQLEVTHPDINSMRRTIRRNEDGSVSIHNDIFRISAGMREGGKGALMFARQVENAHRMGVKNIDTSAAQGAGWNGYYTWARFGYNARLSASTKAQLTRARDLPDAARESRDLHQLMSTKQGRDWWRENGEWTEMDFDLKPNSKHIKVLNSYLGERKAAGTIDFTGVTKHAERTQAPRAPRRRRATG